MTNQDVEKVKMASQKIRGNGLISVYATEPQRSDRWETCIASGRSRLPNWYYFFSKRF